MYLEKERKVIACLKELFPLKSLIRFGAFLLVTVTVMLYAAPVEVPHVFKFGDVVSSAKINANFKALEDRINAVVESVPVGTVVPFAGEVIDSPDSPDEPKPGWLLCDGTELNPSDPKYTELFKTIGTAWGGDGANGFRLPDLRGVFLRGVDNGRQSDPDADGRTSVYSGGNIGDRVGSYQDDAFQGHKWTSRLWNNNNVTGTIGRSNAIPNIMTDYGRIEGIWDGLYELTTDGIHGVPRVANETRPKNAAMNYIVKY